MTDDPGLTFQRYCEHGKLCDDYCEECEGLADHTDPQETPAERYPYLPESEICKHE